MAARVRTPRKNILRKVVYVLSAHIMRIVVFLWAFFKHDVFIFGFGTSLLPGNFDLPILRLFKKRVICKLAHGSESRPPYIDGSLLMDDGKDLKTADLASRAKTMKERCRFIERNADVVICNHFTCHFLQMPFVDRLSRLGRPYALKEHSEERKNRTVGRTRILHAPSHVIGKGTLRFREAIASLKKRGYEIDFVEIIGQDNYVVLKELESCDFVVDTLYSDIPMAGFATEAACFGKPAVIGGYGWETLKKYIPEAMFPPSQICHPDKIEESIEQLMTDEEYRKKLGEKARRFVEEKWSPQAVAERFIQLIDDSFPREWLSMPDEFCYLHGWGYSEKKVKAIIRNMIQNEGLESLQLSDKPNFEQAFKTFAYADCEILS